jgi:hypothetical protein
MGISVLRTRHNMLSEARGGKENNGEEEIRVNE